MNYINKAALTLMASILAVGTAHAVTVTPPGPFTAEADDLTVSIGGVPGVLCRAEVAGTISATGDISGIAIDVMEGPIGSPLCDTQVTVTTAGTGRFLDPGTIEIDNVQIITTLGDCGSGDPMNPDDLIVGWQNPSAMNGGVSAIIFAGATLPYQPAPVDCEFGGSPLETDPTITVTP